MRRLLLLIGALAVLQGVEARMPAGRMDLPCTIECGKYIVTVETAVGPRRFVFDTGASRTTLSERLSRELRLTSAGRSTVGDFEGYRAQVATARCPRLQIGEAVFENRLVDVLPDSSYVWCLGVDGIVGSDLLRRFVVRISAADTTIALAYDYRQFAGLDHRKAVRLHRTGGRPFVHTQAAGDGQRMDCYALFDTGSPGFFACRYHECTELIGRGILRDVRRTCGHAGRLGWTNRSSVREAVRGTVPRLDIGGIPLTDVPLTETYGNTSKIGCGLLLRGVVVIDYPGRRFWLLPYAQRPDEPGLPLYNVAIALRDGYPVVGQVWDETLEGIVTPGDRIVRIGTLDVTQVDPCAFIRGEIRGDKPEITIERNDGTRVTVPIKNL